jgi:antitoxin component of RelBE/YafQ-DinJ toxin-antitoxin module
MERRQKTAQISLRVTNKFKKEFEKIAESKGMTLPDLIRYILTQYLESERKTEEKRENS